MMCATATGDETKSETTGGARNAVPAEGWRSWIVARAFDEGRDHANEKVCETRFGDMVVVQAMGVILLAKSHDRTKQQGSVERMTRGRQAQRPNAEMFRGRQRQQRGFVISRASG